MVHENGIATIGQPIWNYFTVTEMKSICWVLCENNLVPSNEHQQSQREWRNRIVHYGKKGRERKMWFGNIIDLFESAFIWITLLFYDYCFSIIKSIGFLVVLYTNLISGSSIIQTGD